MVMKHIHANLMLQYAEDAAKMSNPWILWEYCDNRENRWWDLSSHPIWHENTFYRRKGKYITIGNYEVPMPETEPLKRGQVYYIAQLFSNFVEHKWNDDSLDDKYLAKGLVHLTKEAATLHTKALLSFTKGEKEYD